MLGVIRGTGLSMMFNKVLFKKEELLLMNTMTGEKVTVNAHRNLLEADFMKSTIKNHLIVRGQSEIDATQFTSLDYKVTKRLSDKSLMEYIKKQHRYMILPDRIEEITNISEYKNSSIILVGTEYNYIIRDTHNKVVDINLLNYLRVFKDELFLQISKNNRVLNIQGILEHINKQSGLEFKSFMVKKDDKQGILKEDDLIELKEKAIY